MLQLRWDWEVEVPELETSIFILPVVDEFQTKNGQERVVVLNSVARRVVDEQRGNQDEERPESPRYRGYELRSEPDHYLFPFADFVSSLNELI